MEIAMGFFSHKNEGETARNKRYPSKNKMLHLKKKRRKKKLTSGSGDQDEDGPFSEIFEDQSPFIPPMPSLTTDDLLDSIKISAVNGRYTPPTSMFDKVYGNKSLTGSSAKTTSDNIGVKNNHVVKRMCKARKKSNAKQKMCPKGIKKADEINKSLRIAKAKSNTTICIINKMFNQEKLVDSVDISDHSDLEDVCQ